ncbi:MAG: hypothetical protein V1869_04700 [Candidatus Omnitrophota bacterium]
MKKNADVSREKRSGEKENGKKGDVSTFPESSARKVETSPFFSSPFSLIFSLSLFIFVLFFSCSGARADTKQWSGKADAASWDKAGNWFPKGVPGSSDDAVVDKQGAGVVISKVSEVFKAKSLTAGGRTDSTVTAENFVYGLIAPDNVTDKALYIRKGGEVVLGGGGGIITLRGAFKNSEEAIPDEPAFMFGAE